MKRIEEMNRAYREIEDFRDKLGETFFDVFMEEDNNNYEVAKSIIHVFDMCETERDAEIADKMLIAICGYSLEALINKIRENEEKDTEKLKELWDLAGKQVREEYEEEWGEGTWEEVDKYEREDHFFTRYFKLRDEYLSEKGEK